MYYQIQQRPEGLTIVIHDFPGDPDHLLAAFQVCQTGQCSCPTREYEKMASLEIDEQSDGVYLYLIPKSGAQFDLDEIRQCLDYTEESVKSEN